MLMQVYIVKVVRYCVRLRLLIFTARCHAERGIAMASCLSVCP